jgi:hypothetical protein
MYLRTVGTSGRRRRETRNYTYTAGCRDGKQKQAEHFSARASQGAEQKGFPAQDGSEDAELELIQTQMTQKPMLREEVYARALRASQNRK